MKTSLLCLLVALPHILAAEEFVAPQAPRREISTQALNPAAPAEYGTGEPNVSKDSGSMRQPSRLSDSSFETSDSPIAKDNHFVRN